MVKVDNAGGAGVDVAAVRVTHAGQAAASADEGPRTLEEIEMEHLLRTLEKHKGNKTTAAAELGISLKTMYNKLNRLERDRRAAG